MRRRRSASRGSAPSPGTPPHLVWRPGLRGMSPRLAMWLFAGILAVLVAAVGAGFAWVNHEGNETVASLRDHMDPSIDTVGRMLAAVRANETEYLKYLLIGNRALLDESHTQAARAAGQLEALRHYGGTIPVVHDALPRLDVQMRAWLDTVQSPAAVPTGGAADNAARAKVRVVASQDLLASAQHLARQLNAERDATWNTAFQDRGNAFLFVEAFAVVLLIVLGAAALLTSRRVVIPLAELEQRMREAAEGEIEGSADPSRTWVTGLAAASERLRMRLRQYHGDSVRDREALEMEGETSIGMSELLTRTGKAGPGVDAHGALVPAQGVVAGDFLDVVALRDGTTALVQGDISGHGVQAGLLAAQAKCTVISALRLGYGAHAAVRSAWSVLMDEDERFLTLSIIILEPARQMLSWVNAGHEPPFLRRADGRVERLEPTGPLVSCLVTADQAPWAVHQTPFSLGDLVVISTDGLTEARNAQGQLLGDEKVEEILSALTDTDPHAAVRTLFLAADRHGTDWRRDDVTVLAAALRDDTRNGDGDGAEDGAGDGEDENGPSAPDEPEPSAG
jgi:serine phosphatase RsbU (regulator of sigma subunit)/CHASE3 domain sensor protein